MGLDQFAYYTSYDRCAGAFKIPEGMPKEILFTWRKHPDLHGWMRNLYMEKKGIVLPTDVDKDGTVHTMMDEEFNSGVGVELTLEDIDKLENVVTNRAYRKTTGFFFGQSMPEDIESDGLFLEKARAVLKGGFRVYYTSWW